MFRHKQKKLIYLLILLLPFFLFFTKPHLFISLKSGIVKFSAVPIKILSFPIKEAKKILYYHRTFNEYKRLKAETDVLKARLIGLEEVILENSRLENLLEFKRKLIYSSVVASVVGREPSRWHSSIIIDKGIEDGLKLGQPVVNALGVVGKIAEVGSTTSKVILLTDPQFSLAALVQRPRESGLVSGTLQGVCRLKFLDEKAKIQVGDKVITSSLSTSFPESLLIGEVMRVEENPGAVSVEALVKPAVSFSQIEEVLVILD